MSDLIKTAGKILTDAGIKNSRFESELILSHLLNIERWNLYVNPPEINSIIEKNFFSLIKKRAQHIPIAYLLKKTYFFNLCFEITSGVFIPRPETETIVIAAMHLFPDKNLKMNVLDVGTGCGALAITIARLFPHATVYATDISKRAVKIAKKNVFLYGLDSRVFVRRADIISGNIRERFSLIVSNPPYLTEDEIKSAPEEVRKEPFRALYGGKNGMEVILKILKKTRDIIERHGFLIFEVSPSQIEFFSDLSDYGFVRCYVFKDISGVERVVVLRKI
ncbi:MAG: peptide chain release factor N(5)-glutamine methyltransferase [Candidatus Omnitrophica bacterium]|nr:peptide chain release factor N(5)-glutamine methyltransferase [Candidatus Omnitrophota bacterium]